MRCRCGVRPDQHRDAAYTYYQRIRNLEHGTTTTITLADGRATAQGTRRYFDLSYEGDDSSEEALAEELACALRGAVRRRTQRRLGRTAVALSGGLDSRAILACVENKDLVFAFSCFDEPNQELRTAEAIAQALEVQFFPWQRGFEYYGDNAEQGVRISAAWQFCQQPLPGRGGPAAGRGSAESADRLLLRLPVQRPALEPSFPLADGPRIAGWLSSSILFRPLSQLHLPGPSGAGALGVQDSREFHSQDSVSKVFQVEARRTFPLCYEGDNQQRVVPSGLPAGFCPWPTGRSWRSIAGCPTITN